MSPATDPPRPRRSVLYMPGANERALQKAAELDADAVILDLEDAVAPDAKDRARQLVHTAVTDGRFGTREVVIRVNGTDTAWFDDDLAAVAAAAPDAVLVPKVSTAAQVHEIETAVDGAGIAARTALWAMLETPAAVLHAESITTASDRLTVFVMGTNDLVKELHAVHEPGRGPLLGALGWCLTAVRAAGKVVIDGVYNDVRDTAGFTAECDQAHRLGFDGKTVIHPSQVGPCNAAFSPTEAQIAEAHEIITAFEEAEAAGRGVVTVGGRMIENLHVAEARRTLAIADSIDDRD